MAENKGIEAAVENKTAKKKKYICTEECYLKGKRYHEGDIIETTAKDLPDYFHEYKEESPAEQVE